MSTPYFSIVDRLSTKAQRALHSVAPSAGGQERCLVVPLGYRHAQILCRPSEGWVCVTDRALLPASTSGPHPSGPSHSTKGTALAYGQTMFQIRWQLPTTGGLISTTDVDVAEAAEKFLST